MKIKLKRRHVLKGGNLSNNCPFYLAVTEACPNLQKVIGIGTKTAYKTSPYVEDLFLLPDDMSNWIQEFDAAYNEADFLDFKNTVPLIEVDLPLEEFCM